MTNEMRLGKLERSHRNLRVACLGLLSLIAGAVLLGAAPSESVQDGKFNKLFVKQLIVGSGSDGEAVIVLSAGSEGANISMVDSNKKDRIKLGFHEGGESGLEVMAKNGAVLSAGVSENGNSACLVMGPSESMANTAICTQPGIAILALKSPKGSAEILFSALGDYVLSTLPNQTATEQLKADPQEPPKVAEAATPAADVKAEHDEKAADGKLRLAESLLTSGDRIGYRNTLKDLIEKYPDTKAAQKARTALK